VPKPIAIAIAIAIATTIPMAESRFHASPGAPRRMSDCFEIMTVECGLTRSFCIALSGLVSCSALNPGLTPWALLHRPFRAGSALGVEPKAHAYVR